MIARISLASLVAGLLAVPSFGQFPPEEPFTPPPSMFKGMPPEIARRLKCDINRVNSQFRSMAKGFAAPLPAWDPLPFDMAIPPMEFSAPGIRRETTYSCVNGCFNLKHQRDGTTFRINGHVIDGQPVLKKIVIEEAAGSCNYARIDEVPACHRKVVTTLLAEIPRD